LSSIIYLSQFFYDVGIPEGARIDAATVRADGKIIFSLDIPAKIGNHTFKPFDLIIYDWFSLELYFDGLESGLPESANLDGVWVNPEGSMLFSLDIPTIIDGLPVTDKDFIEWNGSSFSLPFANISSNLPQAAEVDALALADWCQGDFDADDDVDGSDLAVFAADFGRTNCDQGEECEGDFDGDNDVDGSDLATFAADFGRTDCP